MSPANPLWGAQRIQGQLLKLDSHVSQATVSKYMIQHRKPLSQSWKTFLRNHASDMVFIELLTVAHGDVSCPLCLSRVVS